VAQLGFITLGIFALRPDGANGAVLQMVNHGLVVAAVFVIIAALAARSGTEDLRKMGGMALRAPVLAALFLIVTLATLAMPGSANFVGELYILNGLFDAKIVFAIIAVSGVAMSAYYALRLYQRTMHNRPSRRLWDSPPYSGVNPTVGEELVAEGVGSREIGWRDGVVLAPLVICILGLALYPQLILKRTDPSATRNLASTCGTTYFASSPGAVVGKPTYAGIASYPDCPPTPHQVRVLEDRIDSVGVREPGESP